MNNAMLPKSDVHGLLALHGYPAGILLLLSTVMFPLAPNLVPVSAILAFLFLAIRHRRADAPGWSDVFKTALPFAVLLYLLHVVGMGWSTNVDFGLFDLQIKMPLLLLPVLAFWMKKSSWQGRGALFFAFNVGNVLAVIICICAALWRILHGANAEQELFSSRWSLFLHPSYFAMYLTVGIAGWCLLPRMTHVWIFRGVLVVLCIGVVLSGSKVGWILLLVLLPAILVMRWRDRSLRTSLLGMMGVSLIGLVALVGSSRYALDRVQEVWRAATEKEHKADAETSSEVRWLTWGTTWQLFKEHPLLGTGTGDIKDELVRSYVEHGYTTAAEHRLNAHNQFLQTAACLGLLGFGLIGAMLLVPLFARGGRDPLLAIFLLICLVNWMVESMLEVQAGELFFAFFACIMLWTDDAHRSSPA